MKIEKVSNKQLKILLTSDDLEKRNIKMAELAFGSKKTRDLFKEMMDIATDEYDFVAEGSQLMIEAIPISLESVVIVVTKMDEEQKQSSERNKKIKYNSNIKTNKNDHLSIFEFNTLDDVVLAANGLHGQFTGSSSLLKDKGKYFLFIQNNSQFDEISDTEIDVIVSEYGKKHIVNTISQEYFFEHGELLIDDPAIDILHEYL
jgi:adapter protein MecA 1/2